MDAPQPVGCRLTDLRRAVLHCAPCVSAPSFLRTSGSRTAPAQEREARSPANAPNLRQTAGKPGGFFSSGTHERHHDKEPLRMNAKAAASHEPWTPTAEKTSQTDDERIKD